MSVDYKCLFYKVYRYRFKDEESSKLLIRIMQMEIQVWDSLTVFKDEESNYYKDYFFQFKNKLLRLSKVKQTLNQTDVRTIMNGLLDVIINDSSLKSKRIVVDKSQTQELIEACMVFSEDLIEKKYIMEIAKVLNIELTHMAEINNTNK